MLLLNSTARLRPGHNQCQTNQSKPHVRLIDERHSGRSRRGKNVDLDENGRGTSNNQNDQAVPDRLSSKTRARWRHRDLPRARGCASRHGLQARKLYEMGELRGVELERVLTSWRDEFERGRIDGIPPTILHNLGVA